jgi:hypothetical protein
MHMISVKSSNIKSVGYDPESQVMHVEFLSGSKHAYHGVAPAQHSAMMEASSIGSHFHVHIKSKIKGVPV